MKNSKSIKEMPMSYLYSQILNGNNCSKIKINSEKNLFVSLCIVHFYLSYYYLTHLLFVQHEICKLWNVSLLIWNEPKYWVFSVVFPREFKMRIYRCKGISLSRKTCCISNQRGVNCNIFQDFIKPFGLSNIRKILK